VNGYFAITTNEVLRMPAAISVAPQQLLERILTLEIVRVTERAAVSAARLRVKATRSPRIRQLWMRCVASLKRCRSTARSLSEGERDDGNGTHH
jgi:predicted nucleic acid-binding protein